MSTRFYRSVALRNSSPSNNSNISDAEWVTTSVSSIIFILAFIGNTAALIVMFGSRGPIRLTNNKYLANLACADLLRACSMPFTIVARMKRNFMFGRIICKILPIVQGLSVAVDVFSLVCISVERYLAICHPLLILNLQSVQFSNLFNVLILFLIWFLGLLTALPNFYMYNLRALPNARFKCEKTAVQEFDERIYMVALVTFYFVIPIVVMIVLYTLIIWRICRNSTATQMRSCRNSNPIKIISNISTSPITSFNKCPQYQPATIDSIDLKNRQSSYLENLGQQSSYRSSSQSRSGFSDDDQRKNLQLDMLVTNQQFNRTRAISHPISRPSYEENHYQNTNHMSKGIVQRVSSRNDSHRRRRSSSQSASRIDRHRRKALKLLITLIVEFFVCWTPLYIYHTIGTFNKTFYRAAPTVYVDLILLFSFASASCNPLTYYFMSKRYRSVLYAYLPTCFINKDKRMFMNQKTEQTRSLIKALRLHQQENLVEKKPKEQRTPIVIDIRYHPRLRAKTLQ